MTLVIWFWDLGLDAKRAAPVMESPLIAFGFWVCGVYFVFWFRGEVSGELEKELIRSECQVGCAHDCCHPSHLRGGKISPS